MNQFVPRGNGTGLGGEVTEDKLLKISYWT
jgi:hypothetical protein